MLEKHRPSQILFVTFRSYLPPESGELRKYLVWKERLRVGAPVGNGKGNKAILDSVVTSKCIQRQVVSSVVKFRVIHHLLEIMSSTKTISSELWQKKTTIHMFYSFYSPPHIHTPSPPISLCTRLFSVLFVKLGSSLINMEIKLLKCDKQTKIQI